MTRFPAADFAWTDAPPVRAVMDALNAAGEARFVGGCVRDSLLGRPPAPLAGGKDAGTTDIDVATTLTPEETTRALRAAGLPAHPTGIEHGTVTAVSDGLPVEVTTLRADIDTDGRHATVAFTTDWDEDWRRRDFRLNAMYRGADGALYDPAGGQADLAAARVRFIGDPATRIREDALRILRFFRFTARYADAADANGLAACAAGAALMDGLSRERVWSEVSRLFSAPRAPAALLAAHEAGVLARVLPIKARLDDFARLHRVAHAAVPPALGVEALWPEAEPEAIRAAFKPSGADLARIDAMREAEAQLEDEPGLPLLRLLYRFGREAVLDACLLAAAREDDPVFLRRHAEAAGMAVPVFPVQGRDLLARGLTPGPKLGETLKEAEAAWLAAGLPTDEETIEHILRDAIG